MVESGLDVVESDEIELVENVKEFNYGYGEPMDPPPAKKFNSMADLVEFVRAWSKHHGYAVSKGSSHAGKNIYIQCDCGGTYSGKLENLAKRDSSTRKCECPFQVRGSRSTAKDSTDPYWYLAVKHAQHNHSPSHCPSAHPSHRQLAPEQVKEVRQLTKSNVKTTQILLQLRQSDGETLAVNRTINNEIQKYRREELAGKTPIEALPSILKQSNWVYEVEVDAAGVIQNLFLAHPGSIHLARIYHHMALLDATYKTNWYKLPMLHVMGQAATNKSFLIAFCFLMYENDKGYLWAVNNLTKHVWRGERVPRVFITDRETALRNALAIVFPDSKAHLCAWHINTNIIAACKKHFPSGEKKIWDDFLVQWSKTASSKNVEVFEANLLELKQLISKRPAVLKYLETSILPLKEHFVVAWASHFPHLRNLNTSRVESGHAFIKSFVLNAWGDLLAVWKSLSHAVDHQIAHVHASIGNDTIKTLTNIPRSFFKLPHKISQHAILQAQKQFERLGDLNPTDPCTKTVFTGLGIPCCHMIADILENRGALEANDFHDQWRLDYNPEWLIKEAQEIDLNEEIAKLHLLLSHEPLGQLRRLFEQFHQIIDSTHVVAKVQPPNVKENPKGRPSTKAAHKKGANSTKRLPSAHEIVDAKLDKEHKKRTTQAKQTRSRKRVKKTTVKAEDEDCEAGETDLEDDEVDRLVSSTKGDECAVEQMDPKNERETIQYMSQVPDVFKKYIEDIYNPMGDGNCGFRCLAKALEYPEDGWFRVRQEMVKEVEGNIAFYSRILGGDASINKIIAALKVSELGAKVSQSNWLNKMDHGQVIANTYSRPVIFISTESCGSFLPSRLGPKDNASILNPVYLLHVEGNHWTLPLVQTLNNLKPIPPIIGTKKLAAQRSHDREWKTEIQKQLDLYNQELKSKKK
ncbi:hypothetical protein MJO28_006751 [Puccinia striiformis f. sp. tritici]|uniref:Uncharacterized protein n=1 Tax=Puccinia striiformis f. sp. tritici TaxID=168172 RepID=A0ACC0EJA5_9BASI|nr:hypothetical protein MJO28_006751 [Puccinia striiformis f. sp. tritici]